MFSSKKKIITSPPDYLYRNGVGIVLTNKEKHIFIGKRIDSKNKMESWQMPQGGVDCGEDEEFAMFRELKEETGISQDNVKILYKSSGHFYYNLPNNLQKRLWGGKYLGQKQKWFLLELTAGDNVINIQTEHPEFIEWKWAQKDEVKKLIVDFKKQLYLEVFSSFSSFFK